ncbi:hypothetical protein CYMTET_29779 [Cymbomonas tetramitiformis]|uniref:ABC transporter domain-containing protein n=1 Tax=Cymbomonas tetramitiformis TaxID=36881 RepID=A0AAE0FKC0_9CHLO|nr:hypothetical protein CYMTET_29779 [Cymbomonas tetramitiformis]
MHPVVDAHLVAPAHCAGCGQCILWFMVILVLSNLASTMMCMAIGAAAPNSSTGGAVANMVSSMALMFFFLFGGFLLSKKDMADDVSWLADISFFNYAYEALAVNEFGDPDRQYTFNVKGSHVAEYPVKGEGVLKEFGFDSGRFHADLALISVLCVAFAAITFVLLVLCETGLWFQIKQLLLGAFSSQATTRHLHDLTDPDNPASRRRAGRPRSLSAHSYETLLSLDRLPGRTDTPPQAPALTEGAQEAEEGHGVQGLVLTWSGIKYSVHGGRKVIISDVTGMAGDTPQGRGVLALGSGEEHSAGCARRAQHAGELQGVVGVDGQPMSRSGIRHLSGYVHQDVVLPGTSTVMEYLMFHAALRLPMHTRREARATRCWQIITQLGLQRVEGSRIGDHFVRGLSGGEKRRVSIGAELIKSPAILFLDEPTTGLDSTNATKVVEILAELEQEGVTVMLTIHQPRLDMFRIMARLLLLSDEGTVLYSGPSAAMADYCASLGLESSARFPHMSEFVMDAISHNSNMGAELANTFATSEVLQDLHRNIQSLFDAHDAQPGSRKVTPSRKYTTALFTQIWVLSGRQSRNIVRHPLLILLTYIANAVIASAVGLTYRNAGKDTWGIQNRLGSLFFILIYLAFMSLSSLPLWREERLLFLRERAAGVYSTGAYFAAVILFDIVPLRILPPLFFTFITYPMIGYEDDGTLWRRAAFSITLVLLNVVASTFSMFIGAVSPSNSVANVFGSLLTLLMILFAGFLVNNDSLASGASSWLLELTYGHSAYEALVINQFSNVTGYRFTSYQYSGIGKPPGTDVTGDTILDTFGFHTGTDDSIMWWITDTLCLAALGILYLVLTYFALKLPENGLKDLGPSLAPGIKRSSDV